MPLYKFRSKTISYGILTAVIIYSQTWITAANSVPHHHFGTALTIAADTTKPPLKKPEPVVPRATSDAARTSIDDTNRINRSDTTPVRGVDSGFMQKTDTFNLKLSKDSLEAPLKYTAEDSVVVMVKSKKIYLYGKTKTEYTDITLTAPKVEMDQNTQVVTAYNEKDSTGKILENAKFKQAENEFSSDTIRYNFKTQVGLTKNTMIPQGEILILGNTIKKVNENTSFIKGARFTTCMLDDPHFAFTTPKMKVINQKLAISGPAHPEFEGVPLPILLPFGIYPLTQGRHSGFIAPSFTANDQLGWVFPSIKSSFGQLD